MTGVGYVTWNKCTRALFCLHQCVVSTRAPHPLNSRSGWKCLWNMSGAWAPGGLTTDGETQGPGKDAKPRSGSWKPKTLPEDQLYNEQQTVLKGKYLIWGGALFSLYQNNTDFGSKPQGLMTKKIKLCVIICHSKTPGKPFKYASVLCERWCWFFLIETGKLKRRWAEWR